VALTFSQKANDDFRFERTVITLRAAAPAFIISTMASLPNVYIPFDDKKDEENQLPQKKPAWNHQVQSFLILSAPYFRESPSSKCLLCVILVLALLSSAVRVVFSYLMRDFWSALADRQVDEFYQVLIKFFVALLVLVPINVLYRYQRQRLAIFWREWMTERTLELYYSNRVYYKLERSHSKSMDNVDQRIQEDVRSFTVFSLSFFLILLNSFLDLVAFSVILFSIRPELFAAIVLFAFLGTVATWLIGKKLIILNFEKLKREANFRYVIMLVSSCSELPQCVLV
jgi:putative ATP-binding cassette transporter